MSPPSDGILFASSLTPAIINAETELAATSMAEPREGWRPPVTGIPTDPATGEPMFLSTDSYGAEVAIHLDPDSTVDVFYKGVWVLEDVWTGYVPTQGRFGSASSPRIGLSRSFNPSSSCSWAR